MSLAEEAGIMKEEGMVFMNVVDMNVAVDVAEEVGRVVILEDILVEEGITAVAVPDRLLLILHLLQGEVEGREGLLPIISLHQSHHLYLFIFHNSLIHSNMDMAV